MRWIRLLLALTLFAAAILFVILATAKTDTAGAQSSVDNHKLMLVDLQKVGSYTEGYRTKYGSPPDDRALDKWLQNQKFETLIYSTGLGMQLEILPKSGKCGDIDVSALGSNQNYSYFLCYTHKSFRFLKDDAFIPQTGASSLATSLKVFEMSLSDRLASGLIASVLLVLAWMASFWRNALSTSDVETA
jgi:hypothetical protein